jgi:uncharacterized protein YeaO (DUF488 family)
MAGRGLSAAARGMEIRTGYFARAKEYMEQGYTVIGISRWPPKWLDVPNLKALAPGAELLRDYQLGRADDAEYDRRYTAKLEANKDAVTYILDYIAGQGTTKCVFCCYEKPGSSCHRHLLAGFLEREYGMSVTEMPAGRKQAEKETAGPER